MNIETQEPEINSSDEADLASQDSGADIETAKNKTDLGAGGNDEETNDHADEASAEIKSQEEMPFAFIQGQAVTELPQDLYIPPDALEIILEAFEGPLDLLLYMIKKQNLDILNINVAEITEQYMEYIEIMKTFKLELAAEYLVMAAMLAEIKSRFLLPRPESEDEDEGDPRAELIRRLQEYERFKKAAEDIDALPRVSRDFQLVSAKAPVTEREKVHPDIEMKELMLALREVLVRTDMFESHHIQSDTLSIREKMSSILESLKNDRYVPFVNLFSIEEGRLGVVVTFIAMLELIKESLVEIIQNEPFAPIHLRAKSE